MEYKETENIKNLVAAVLQLRVNMKKFIWQKIHDEKLDITYEMVQVIGMLGIMGDTSQQVLADRVHKNKASLTSLLDNLAKRKLIVRIEDPSDRRYKIISLTKAGREYQKQLEPLMVDLYQTLHEGINVLNVINTVDTLKSMYENILPEHPQRFEEK
ncbi:transcriptional regulator, MarR family [bacterium A37T11]|nr:transcriptional regulator, MarR family [bacterium A37T11]